MDFKACFERYGADYTVTMERFMFREEMYLRFLNMMLEDENFLKLKTALEADDLEAAFEAAHTLKGVSANMGLTPLYEKVCGVVEPLRSRRTDVMYSEKIQEIENEMARIQAFCLDLEKCR